MGREAGAQGQAQLRQGGRLLEALLGLRRQLQRHAGLLIEPFLAFGGGLGQQLLGVHHHGDRDLLARRAVGDPHAGTAGLLHHEAHDSLVDRADLLHIERAVVEPLGHLVVVREPQQPGEHLLHHVVADRWQVGEHVALVAAARFAALQKRIGVGIKQFAVARWQIVRIGAAAVVHQPEQAEQRGPGTAPVGHGVLVLNALLAQAIGQSADAVVLPVERVLRHQRFVFRVEQEHQPQQHRDQPAIEVLLAFFCGGQLAQHGASALASNALGRIEAQQQFPQGFQHLFGQAGAHLVLVFAAGRQQLRQALLRVAAEQPVDPQQQLQCAEHRPARHLRHRFERQRQPAARFAPRRMNQPQLAAVEQQADGDLRFLQQPLEALLRRGVPAVPAGVPGGVEVAAPLGIRLTAGVAPLGEVEHQGLQLRR